MAEKSSQDGGRIVAQHAAVFAKIAQTLSRYGVAPLPRNYELFYEALSGHNPALSRDFASLGARPSQGQLEQLGLKHNLPGYAALSADRARAAAAYAIGGLTAPLNDALERRHAFADQLQTFLDRLASDPVVGMSDFADEATLLRDTATRLLRDEQAFAGTLRDAVSDLRGLESGIEQDRKALARDGVTGLPNRLAFSANLSGLFDAKSEIGTAAVVMVVVERLQHLGHEHGPVAFDKALKKLAAVFRKSIKKNDFVARVGLDEFAFVFRDLNAENAKAVADRIRASVEAIEFSVPSRIFTAQTLSLSAGIAMTASAVSASDLFTQAELALKAAHASSKPATLVFSAAIGSKVEKTYSHSAA